MCGVGTIWSNTPCMSTKPSGIAVSAEPSYKDLQGLIDSTETAGIWTIQAGIFPENLASIRLHRVAGFRIVGTRERVGKMATGNSPASGGTWS